MERVYSRDSDKIPFYLRGACVSVTGVVASVRHNNPFTLSKQKSRQRMLLLSPVTIAGTEFDHTWLHGNKYVDNAEVVDRFTLFAKLGTYSH